jgi:Sfi1 spindle body protein
MLTCNTKGANSNFNCRRSRNLMLSTFMTWSSYVKTKAKQMKLLRQFQMHRKHSLLSSILYEWKLRTQTAKSTAHKVGNCEFCKKIYGIVLSGSCQDSWRMTLDVGLGQIQFFRNKHLAHLAMSSLEGWRSVIESRKCAENLIMRMQMQQKRKLMTSAFCSFQLAVEIQKRSEQQASELAQRRLRILKAKVLRGWQVSNVCCMGSLFVPQPLLTYYWHGVYRKLPMSVRLHLWRRLSRGCSANGWPMSKRSKMQKFGFWNMWIVKHSYECNILCMLGVRWLMISWC